MAQYPSLKKFLDITPQSYPITTAYISVDIRQPSRQNYITELKKLIQYKKRKSYFRELSQIERESVLEDFDKILKYAKEDFNINGKLTSVCFSSSAEGIWETVNFNIPFRTDIEVQPYPYIRLLAGIYSGHRNYAVLLIDRNKARIFESRLGENIEHFHIRENSYEKIKYGGYYGRDERSVERNIRNMVIQHYKRVADEIFNLNRKRDFSWIIIGGRREIMNEFRRYLHEFVIGKILGEMEVDPDAHINDVLDRVKETENVARKKFEEELVRSMKGKLHDNLAVEGLHGVITASRKRAVKTLIFTESFVQKGVFCKKCDYLSIECQDNCPVCGVKLYKTNDIVELLLHRVLRNGGDVEVLDSDTRDFPGIGAILHFPVA
ncbi:MAG TPA: hypothetical protein ENF20_08035 [Candidatus Marinimicrobia bacterium]|nr:hypothetical protein [Candidatus Neomarinimicrobiota bacterium]